MPVAGAEKLLLLLLLLLLLQETQGDSHTCRCRRLVCCASTHRAVLLSFARVRGSLGEPGPTMGRGWDASLAEWAPAGRAGGWCQPASSR